MPYMRFFFALLLTLGALSTPFAARAGDASAPAVSSGATAPETPPPPPPVDTYTGVPLATVTASALGAEQRQLKAGEVEFPVFVRAHTAATARGTVLLLPGDGDYPGSPPGIDHLREELRPFGWNTWLVALEPPPRVRTDRLPRDGTTGDTSPAGAGDAKAEDPKPPEAAAADAQPAATPADATAEQKPDTDAERSQRWLDAGLQRIGAAVAAAQADGEVVIVAEASTAALLRHYLAQNAGAGVPRAAVFIQPVAWPELRIDWPARLKTPVLEVLSQAQHESQGGALEQEAKRLGLTQYRQVTIEIGGLPDGSESLLTRSVRGWLKSLPKPRAAPAPGPAADGGTKV